MSYLTVLCLQHHHVQQPAGTSSRLLLAELSHDEVALRSLPPSFRECYAAMYEINIYVIVDVRIFAVRLVALCGLNFLF